jgi:hypothetical protein
MRGDDNNEWRSEKWCKNVRVEVEKNEEEEGKGFDYNDSPK